MLTEGRASFKDLRTIVALSVLTKDKNYPKLIASQLSAQVNMGQELRPRPRGFNRPGPREASRASQGEGAGRGD